MSRQICREPDNPHVIVAEHKTIPAIWLQFPVRGYSLLGVSCVHHVTSVTGKHKSSNQWFHIYQNKFGNLAGTEWSQS